MWRFLVTRRKLIVSEPLGWRPLRSLIVSLMKNCCMTVYHSSSGSHVAEGVPFDFIDDVVQETLLTVHQARHTYDPNRSFTAWLRTIAQRRAIDGLRRAAR